MQVQEVPKDLEVAQGNCPPAVLNDSPFHGDGKFYLSKSRLNRYISCPYSYLLHYKLGIRPIRKDTDLLIGLATHRLIAAHHIAKKKGGFVDPDLFLKDFWSQYTKGVEDAAILQEMKTAQNESLRYAKLFIQDAPIDPLEIEYSFSIPLIDLANGDTLPISLVGIIDLIDQENGTPRPLEIKTRARKADLWQIKTALELTCYAYWVRQQIIETTSQEPEEIPVGYINIIKTKTPSIQWQTDYRSLKDFLKLYHTAKAVYENIMEERFYQNPGTHCNWCDFSAICKKDKDEIIKTFGDATYLRLWEEDLI